MYVLGSLFTGGKSISRQDKSLVQRTYQTKILDDDEMNKIMGNGIQPGKSGDANPYDNDPTKIISSLYKLLVARQRLPSFSNKMARLFFKGKKRLHEDLDIVNQARNTQRMKAMSQILLTDQQRMIMTLNKRSLLEEGESSEPMTDTPPNSGGETVSQKLQKDF